MCNPSRLSQIVERERVVLAAIEERFALCPQDARAFWRSLDAEQSLIVSFTLTNQEEGCGPEKTWASEQTQRFIDVFTGSGLGLEKLNL